MYSLVPSLHSPSSFFRAVDCVKIHCAKKSWGVETGNRAKVSVDSDTDTDVSRPSVMMTSHRGVYYSYDKASATIQLLQW